MPSIAHLFLGGIFGIFLYYISDKKFSKYHVFILFMNNYLGPDTGWALGIGDYTHSLVGWTIYAFLVAVLYHYFTRFTLKIDGLKKIEITDLERPRLQYLNVYFLVLAGGIMHVYLDGMINAGGMFTIVPSISPVRGGWIWSLEDFMTIWTEGALNLYGILVLSLGILFILGFIFVFVWFLKANPRRVVIVSIFYIIAFSILFLLGGAVSTGEHSDVGAIFYIALFWLIPLGLMVLSTRRIPLLAKKIEEEDKEIIIKDKPGKVSKLKHIYLILSLGLICMSVILWFFRANLLAFLIDRTILSPTYATFFLNALNIACVVLLGIGGLIGVFWVYLRKILIHNTKILIISIWLFFSGLIGISISIFGIFLNEAIVNAIYLSMGETLLEYASLADLYNLIIVVAIILIGFSSINVICASGLTIKSKKIWRISIFYHLILSWTIIGLVIACALSENSVKFTMQRIK